MGNHEYCDDCGQNTFHNGRPCDPERVARRQSEILLAKAKWDKAISLKRELMSNINNLNKCIEKSGSLEWGLYDLDKLGYRIEVRLAKK